MEDNWNLSEKIIEANIEGVECSYFNAKDVKEFLRLLKEEIKAYEYKAYGIEANTIKVINELAGSQLVEK